MSFGEEEEEIWRQDTQREDATEGVREEGDVSRLRGTEVARHPQEWRGAWGRCSLTASSGTSPAGTLTVDAQSPEL